VFSDPGVLTAGQKIPARDSESPEEERPEGKRPNIHFLQNIKEDTTQILSPDAKQKKYSDKQVICPYRPNFVISNGQ
jgi:hypothetical protein